MNSKQQFAQSLEKLLYRKTLDEIQVKEIVAGTKLSRKTFYRHFCDKYALANWYFDQFYRKSFATILEGNTWEDALLKCLDIYEEKQVIFRNGYESGDVNNMVNHDIKATSEIYREYLKVKGGDVSSDSLNFAIEIAARGGVSMLMEWLFNGMKIPKKRFVQLLKMTLPQEMLQYIYNDIEKTEK